MRKLLAVLSLVSAFAGTSQSAWAGSIELCLNNTTEADRYYDLVMPNGDHASFKLSAHQFDHKPGDSEGKLCQDASPFDFPACPNEEVQQQYDCNNAD